MRLIAAVAAFFGCYLSHQVIVPGKDVQWAIGTLIVGFGFLAYDRLS